MLVPSDSPIIETMHLLFAILPLIFLVVLKKYKMAVYYLGMYLFSALVPKLLIPYLPNIINVLFTGMIALFTQILPGMMMAYFLIVSTTVSEFVAAMDRMHVTKKYPCPFLYCFVFSNYYRRIWTCERCYGDA